MIKNIIRLIWDFTESRTDEIDNDLAEENQKVKDLTLSIITLLEELKRTSSSENLLLLEELEDLRTKRSSIVVETIYRKGLFDGIKIENVFHRIKSRDIKQFEELFEKE